MQPQIARPKRSLSSRHVVQGILKSKGLKHLAGFLVLPQDTGWGSIDVQGRVAFSAALEIELLEGKDADPNEAC